MFDAIAFDAGLAAALPPGLSLGAERRISAEVGSTNDEAAAWARSGAPHGALVIADTQRSGRGRLGRRWSSPSGEGLYFSIVLRPDVAPAAAPPLTLAVGLALLDLARGFGVRARLKWPNDLLADEPAAFGGHRRKLAGVLTEMATAGLRIEHVIVGIGLNVGAEHLPPEVANLATSLSRASGRPIERVDAAAALLRCLDLRYRAFLDEGAAATVAAWKREVDFLGRRVVVSAGADRLDGVAEDLDEEGALRLRTPDGKLHRLWAGDVTVAATADG